MELSYIKGIATPSDKIKLKIAIVGEPKTGKSWLSTTGEGETFVFDFDTRSESIIGKPRTTVKTYADVDPLNPGAMNEVEKDITAFEYYARKGEPIPDTFVLDSATYMQKACEKSLAKTHDSLGRDLKIGGKSIRIGQGWDIINGSRAYMEYCIGRLSALGNLIMVFHEQDEKDNTRSTKDQKAYTGRVTVQPQYLSSLLSVFNEVWRIEIEYNGTYNVTVKPNNEFLSSTSLKIDGKQKPNISEILAQHRANLAKERG